AVSSTPTTTARPARANAVTIPSPACAGEGEASRARRRWIRSVAKRGSQSERIRRIAPPSFCRFDQPAARAAATVAQELHLPARWPEPLAPVLQRQTQK